MPTPVAITIKRVNICGCKKNDNRVNKILEQLCEKTSVGVEMKKRKDLPSSQLYESMYAPVQTIFEDGDVLKKKLKFVENQEKQLKKEIHSYQSRFYRTLVTLWQATFGHFGEEWFFLAFLGILVALISYMIDRGALMCNLARMWLFRDLAEDPWARYFGWISLPVCLCMFSAGFCKLVAPKTTGSGIPEIKTILRGVYLQDVLTFKALVAKVVGITSTLGSGMPLGKEGPLIHISSCCVTLLGKLTNFQGIYQNESRKVEMLAAACAVGVGCCFAAPIGGVLLSVELTTSYFAVRNYWRGFCAAVWGTTFYRLLLVWIEGVESVTVVFKTSFFVDTPFAAQELFAFWILGIICGLGGAFWLQMNRNYGKFVRTSSKIIAIKKANFFIYPGFISLVVASIMFPIGIGQFMASHVPYGGQVIQLFSNFSFTENVENLTLAQLEIVKNWQSKWTGIYLNIICFIAFNGVCSILASTMPIPSGTFGPTFRMGAGVGRIMGELMRTWYPTGLSYYGRTTQIIPGGYSIVGAAAFAGAVTQTMSVSVIILEMTSQISHVLPILIAVLTANGISQLCGRSSYNTGIKAKNLPYLPDLLPTNSAMYSVYVEDFMIKDYKYIFHGMTFERLKDLLKDNKKIISFPLVNNPVRLILLGSIQRFQLVALLEKQVGKSRRLLEMTENEEKLMHSNLKMFTDNPLYQEPSPNRTNKPKSVKLPGIRICDLPPNKQKLWEQEQMKASVDFSNCHIDPAPFQLVERTSLLKVHTLFSLVGVNTAYVTSVGKLVGVVGLADLRQAIEDVNSGKLKGHNIEIVITTTDDNK